MAEQQKIDTAGIADKDIVSLVEELYSAGAHFGYSRTKRHSSTKSFVYGSKNRMDILDLEKMAVSLKMALDFIAKMGAEGKQILFVGNKKEARGIVEDSAKSIGMPYVTLRWIGGTLTNSTEIKKRIARMEDLMTKKATGGLDVYTKKEKLLLDREITKLQKFFGGIVNMRRAPSAVVVIDSDFEKIAVTEAIMSKIPVVSLSSTDCNISRIALPVVANDSSSSSISYFISKIVDAYKSGIKMAPKLITSAPVVPNAKIAKHLEGEI